MSAATRWLVLALAAAAFLAAAKAHGRQLRLERELAGYWDVSFVTKNPAFVEALWHRERIVFWGIAGGIGLATIFVRWFLPRLSLYLPFVAGPSAWSLAGGVVLHVLLPLTVAFVISGMASLVRFATKAPSTLANESGGFGFWCHALWGSAGWWAFSLGVCAGLFVLAWRRSG